MQTVTKAPEAARGPALNIRRLSLLLVDDNPFMRTLLRAVVKAYGCRDVTEANDGVDALEVLATQFVPDIIITNWQMPRLDGMRLVQKLRGERDKPIRYVPIVMVSGHSEQRRILAARDAGVNEFLVKPISAKLLYARIVRLIEFPRPFVESATYFGPDRRRRADVAYAGPERRKNPDTKTTPTE